MSVDSYLKIEIRRENQPVVTLPIGSEEARLDDFLRNLSLTSSTGKKTIDLKSFLTESEIKLLEFHCVKEWEEGGIYATVDIDSIKLQRIYDIIMGQVKIFTDETIVEEIMDITKWKSTREDQPKYILEALHKSYGLLNMLQYIAMIVRQNAAADTTIKLITTYE